MVIIRPQTDFEGKVEYRTGNNATKTSLPV